MDPCLILEVNLVHPLDMPIHRQSPEVRPDQPQHWVGPIFNNSNIYQDWVGS
jgi:hypothetical protein